jgi:hypothetical protein
MRLDFRDRKLKALEEETAALKAERDEYKRKGELLCCELGNLMMRHEELRRLASAYLAAMTAKPDPFLRGEALVVETRANLVKALAEGEYSHKAFHPNGIHITKRDDKLAEAGEQ